MNLTPFIFGSPKCKTRLVDVSRESRLKNQYKNLLFYLFERFILLSHFMALNENFYFRIYQTDITINYTRICVFAFSNLIYLQY